MKTTLMRMVCLVALALVAGACGSESGSDGFGADAGFGGVNPVPTPGNGWGDVGATDSGWGRVEADVGGRAYDAGSSDDTGGSSDAGSSDAGGASDAGASDTGAQSAADAGASGDVTEDTGGGNTGLSQAGAQDFGLFRQILQDGGIPAPSTLDDLGFFAEHKLDYPKPTCGQDMCMHALLGEMGNLITGSTCTLMQIGLNTPIQVDKLKRPPLHLVLAIDVSASMKGAALDFVKQGLSQMLDNLGKDDHVTLVTFAGSATTHFEHKGLSAKNTMLKAVLGLKTAPATHLYDGLFTAFAKASKHLKKGTETRVLLLSDGQPTKGITKASKFVSLAKAYALQGIGITTVGVGKGFDIEILRDIAEVGAGNFYFLDQPAAVKEVFTEEVKTFLVPIALDVKMDISVGDAWVVRDGYGTKGWKAKSGGGHIHIPSLFLAGRLKSDDPLPTKPGTGRRGGGGAILIEAMPFPGIKPKTTKVGTVSLSWKHPQTGKVIQQTAVIDKKAAKMQIADGGIFTDPTVEKGFVMLNLYVGFKQASELAVDGDPGAAIGTLQALKSAVDGWLKGKVKQGLKPDPDITDDLIYVDLFLANLAKLKQQTPISKPPEPWPVD